jgi:hypothetical protein
MFFAQVFNENVGTAYIKERVSKNSGKPGYSFTHKVVNKEGEVYQFTGFITKISKTV